MFRQLRCANKKEDPASYLLIDGGRNDGQEHGAALLNDSNATPPGEFDRPARKQSETLRLRRRRRAMPEKRIQRLQKCAKAWHALRVKQTSLGPDDPATESPIIAPITVNGHRIYAEIDSGAAMATIDLYSAQSWGMKIQKRQGRISELAKACRCHAAG
jgi:hypothetical protein